MSRHEKIAFIRVNMGYVDLEHYSDEELDSLIQEIIIMTHHKDLGIEKLGSIYVFLN